MTEIKPKIPVLRRWLIAGILVWAPLLATFWVITMLVGFLDKSLLLLPREYRPEELLGFTVPGFGVLLAVVVVITTGALAANFFGRRIVALGEAIVNRIPLVSSVYSAVKQVIETFVSEDSRSFRKVLLIEYPRKGVWSLAFLSGDSVGEMQERTCQKVLTVFVPTAPNPTSGFVILVPEEDVIELEMSVEEGFRMVVSLGVVVPQSRKPLPDGTVSQAPSSGAGS
ncbi:MAG: DUF502 domain-containing protein [Halothiobacillaceae bacterium]